MQKDIQPRALIADEYNIYINLSFLFFLNVAGNQTLEKIVALFEFFLKRK